MGIEKIRRKLSAPGINKRESWSGITDIVSGASTIVVSASQILSGAAILCTLGLTTVASHRDIVVSVNSLVSNTSMVIVANKATVGSQQICYIVFGN